MQKLASQKWQVKASVPWRCLTGAISQKSYEKARVIHQRTILQSYLVCVTHSQTGKMVLLTSSGTSSSICRNSSCFLHFSIQSRIHFKFQLTYITNNTYLLNIEGIKIYISLNYALISVKCSMPLS